MALLINKIKSYINIKNIFLVLISLLGGYVYIYYLLDKNIYNSLNLEKEIKKIEENSPFVKKFNKEIDDNRKILIDQENNVDFEESTVENENINYEESPVDNVDSNESSVIEKPKDDFFSKYEKF
jgi:predicted  nucleic acid-binding Zn-ribbon protein